MYCKNCGTEINDNTSFCPNCGQSVNSEASNPAPAYKPDQVSYTEPAQPVYEQPQYQPTQAPVYAQKLPNVLMWGILSVCFCESGLIGLIFSIIAKNKAKRWQTLTGSPLIKGGKVGNILATIGLVVSIIMTVVWLIYIIVAIVAVITAASYYGHAFYY